MLLLIIVWHVRCHECESAMAGNAKLGTERGNATAWLLLALLNIRPQALEWHHPHSEWVFQIKVHFSGNALTETHGIFFSISNSKSYLVNSPD